MNLVNLHASSDATFAAAFEANVQAAINEDVGSGDVTGLLISDSTKAKHEWSSATARSCAALRGLKP